MSISITNAQAATVAEFRTINGAFFTDNSFGFIAGNSSELDGGGGIYVFDTSSTDTDDGFLVLKPDNILTSNPGRWKRYLRFETQSDWAETDAGVPSYIQNKPVIPDSPDESQQTPVVNTPTQATDTDRNATINASISISVTSTLLGTNSGTVFFEISADGSTNWLLRSQIGNSVAGVASTVIATHFISGFLPAGWFYRLRTAVSGTNGATFTVLTGQEILL